MSAVVNLDVLAAVAQSATADETRHYLRGVHISAGPTHTTYVATDGKTIIGVRCPEENTSSFSVIYPLSKVKPFKRSKRSVPFAEMSVDGLEVNLEYGVERASFLAVEGEFPEWPRVLPGEVSGEAGHFNFDLLARFSEAARIADWGLPALRQNGELDAAFVQFSGEPNAFGVIMPVRVGLEPARPEWLSKC